MTLLIKDVLAQRATNAFVGRVEELKVLLSILEDDGARIAFLHGIAGIGKSTLLERFIVQARAQGVVVVSLNCETIEPTERGFLNGLSIAIGASVSAAQEAAARLTLLGNRVVLTLDNYEVFRLMDTWLRQAFIPLLPENLRAVFAGRDAPPLTWLISPGWADLVRTIPLESLREAEAVELLLNSGAQPEDAQQINRFAQGHPLALKLAATVGADARASDNNMTPSGFPRVVEELTRLYLADVSDPLTRNALEAASTVRRVTLSVLQAMLPGAAPQDTFGRLHALPFVRSERDGLQLHDLVRKAIGSSLRATDPDRYQEYRRSAWRQLRTESRRTGLQELWRYTADLLYLIENPAVREAFFPTGGPQYVIEPASEEDGPAIQDLSRRHEPSGAARMIETWWNKVPQAFHVARDQDNRVAGFYLMFDPSTIDPVFLQHDPIAMHWWGQLRNEPVPHNQRVLFLRRWLDRENGEKPSPVQAACWLDIKRIYMEMRPQLRRVYLSLRDLAPYASVAEKLRFQPLPGNEVEIDGNSYSTAVLDFGPSSVDGWLASMAAAELGFDEQEDDILDKQAHELVIDGNRVKLTKLEFEVFLYLYQRKGKAVTRSSLIEDVWGWKQTGSNVIEAVVRSLRKKLGSKASSIETIRGSGYRYRCL